MGYFLLILTFIGFVYLECFTDISNFKILIISFFAAFLAGFWLSFIQLFVHEAAHYNIHPNKKTNDFLANIFIGLILGINIKCYRKTHWNKSQERNVSFLNILEAVLVTR